MKKMLGMLTAGVAIAAAIWGSGLCAAKQVGARLPDQGVHAINRANPGQRIDVTKLLVKGKLNIVDFYSVYCPPCMRIAPLLERLAQADPEVVVNKVDINRPGVQGIDWQSPLARQYELQSIPHFRVYDGKGSLVAEGEEAFKLVLDHMQRAGVQ